MQHRAHGSVADQDLAGQTVAYVLRGRGQRGARTPCPHAAAGYHIDVAHYRRNSTNRAWAKPILNPKARPFAYVRAIRQVTPQIISVCGNTTNDPRKLCGPRPMRGRTSDGNL